MSTTHADEDEVLDAALEVFAWHPATRDLTAAEREMIAQAVVEVIWTAPDGPTLHSADLTYPYRGWAPGRPDCRYCAGTGFFYADRDLGLCGCDQASADIDIESIIG